MSELVELEILRVAHGGHCVARHDDQVVFVRHTLPGEKVRAELTGEGPKGRFLLADAVEILEPAPGRIPTACPVSGPGGCGGCDWQHADIATELALKTDVVREQMSRMAGVQWDGQVQSVPGDEQGLEWRTRVSYSTDPDGAVGFRKHRSNDVVPVTECPIATKGIQTATCGQDLVTAQSWQTAGVSVVDPSGGGVVVEECDGSPARVIETAAGRNWHVPVDGFWQVHPGAPVALCSRVVAAAQGFTNIWDLYGGVGLFAGAISQAAPRDNIDLVETDRGAVACANKNLSKVKNLRVHRKSVLPWLEHGIEMNADVDCVVLDPPRKGAGKKVLDLLSRSRASRLVYVACDPSALGRDTKLLLEKGWKLQSLEALNLFPKTQHIECVAIFDR